MSGFFWEHLLQLKLKRQLKITESEIFGPILGSLLRGRGDTRWPESTWDRTSRGGFSAAAVVSGPPACACVWEQLWEYACAARPPDSRGAFLCASCVFGWALIAAVEVIWHWHCGHLPGCTWSRAANWATLRPAGHIRAHTPRNCRSSTAPWDIRTYPAGTILSSWTDSGGCRNCRKRHCHAAACIRPVVFGCDIDHPAGSPDPADGRTPCGRLLSRTLQNGTLENHSYWPHFEPSDHPWRHRCSCHRDRTGVPYILQPPEPVAKTNDI